MSLVMHAEKTRKCGVTLADLRDMPVPPRTKTHVPISHATLRDMVAEKLTPIGLEIRNENHAVADWADPQIDENGVETPGLWQKAFGIFDVKGADSNDGEIGFTVGYRNSVNKKLSAGICFGSKVFVCDNLCFSAEIILKRRHTKNILDALPELIEEKISGFEIYRNRQIELYDRLRNAKIDNDEAASIVVNAVSHTRKGFLAKKNILDILETYNHDPATDEERESGILYNIDQHGYGTAWSLFNAGTRFAKTRLERNLVDGSSELVGWHNTFAKRFLGQTETVN